MKKLVSLIIAVILLSGCGGYNKDKVLSEVQDTEVDIDGSTYSVLECIALTIVSYENRGGTIDIDGWDAEETDIKNEWDVKFCYDDVVYRCARWRYNVKTKKLLPRNTEAKMFMGM